MTDADKSYTLGRIPGPSDGDGGEVQMPTARDVLRILFRHKWLIVITFLLISATGLTFVSQMPDVYQSESRLLLRLERGDLSIDPASPGLVQSGMGRSMNATDNEISILSSESLQETVASVVGPERILGFGPGETVQEKFSDKKDPETVAIRKAARAIARNLTLGSEGDIIIVRFESTNPVLAHDVVEALVARYLERHLEVHRSSLDPQIVRKEADDLQAKIRELERQLATYNEKNDAMSVSDLRSLLNMRKTEYEAALAQNRIATESSRAMIDALKKGLEGIMGDSGIPPTQMPNPEVTPFQERLNELKVRQLELSQIYSGGNELQSMNDQIAELERKIDSMPATVPRRFASATEGPGMDPVVRLENEQLNLQALQAAEAQLRRELENTNAQLAEIGDDSEAQALENELRTLRADADAAEDAYRRVVRSELLDKEKVSNVSVLQAANVPDVPVGPRRTRNMAIVIFFGLAAGFGLAIVREFLDDRLKSRDDIERKLGLPVLAVVTAEDFRKCI